MMMEFGKAERFTIQKKGKPTVVKSPCPIKTRSMFAVILAFHSLVEPTSGSEKAKGIGIKQEGSSTRIVVDEPFSLEGN